MKPPYRLLFFLIAPFLLLACEKEKEDDDPVEKEGVGEAAAHFLKGDPYGSLQVDIFYMDGYEPKDRAVDSLKRFLQRYLNKPAGIGMRKERVASLGADRYGLKEIDRIIEEHRRYSMGPDRIYAYLLFVDGRYEADGGSSNTLGVAYRAHRSGLFGASIEEHSDAPTEPPRWKLEASVMRHEFGHLLGLVDKGTDMVNEHKDDGNGAHCDNNDCLMYYQVETSDIVSNLVGSEIPPLDSNCQKDLRANGGK